MVDQHVVWSQGARFCGRLCNGIVRLSARGASVIFPSGDNGDGRGECIVNDTPSPAGSSPSLHSSTVPKATSLPLIVHYFFGPLPTTSFSLNSITCD